MKRYINKYIVLFIFILFCSLISSCAPPSKKKVSNDYYSKILIFELKQTDKINCIIFDPNYYKKYTVQDKDIDDFKKFFLNLTSEEFISKPASLPSNPKYKIFFTLSQDKFVINVYDERYISLYPYDGTQKMDYIDMKNTYNRYNLFYLCKYFIPRY